MVTLERGEFIHSAWVWVGQGVAGRHMSQFSLPWGSEVVVIFCVWASGSAPLSLELASREGLDEHNSLPGVATRSPYCTRRPRLGDTRMYMFMYSGGGGISHLTVET